MSIVLVGSTSGSITLQEPAIAGTTVLDLPAVSGTFITTTGGVAPSTAGNVLTSNGTAWTSATPATPPAPAALSTATGSAPSYSARAWVNFNGTGTVAIRASGNVSSITDNATGDYTINFTTAMQDANYSVVSVGFDSAANVLIGINQSNAPTTTTVGVASNNRGTGASVDVGFQFFAIFR